jgi:hypothetical protein
MKILFYITAVLFLFANCDEVDNPIVEEPKKRLASINHVDFEQTNINYRFEYDSSGNVIQLYYDDSLWINQVLANNGNWQFEYKNLNSEEINLSNAYTADDKIKGIDNFWHQCVYDDQNLPIDLAVGQR